MSKPMPSSSQFAAIRESLLRTVAEQGRITTFPKDTMIIREGEHGDTMFVILSGRVKVFSSSREGIISTLQALAIR